VNFRHARRPDVSINLTPLIDVVFLLLIFFMVSTSFSELTQLTVNLPEADGARATDEIGLVVVIDSAGNVTVGGDPVPNEAEGLYRALEAAANGNVDVPLTLSADAMTPHQYVVMVLDVASLLGLQRVTIATESMINE
jgi:biopolymer transport protein ExbD